MSDAQILLRDSLPVMRKIMIYLEAKPLHSLIAVALENVVNAQEGGLYAALSSRMNYIETGLISTVCALYNLIVALGLTLPTAVTCGKVKTFRYIFSKHWLHAVIAGCGVVISGFGCVSPLVGAVATGAMLSVVVSRVKAAWKTLKLPSRKERIQMVRAFYAERREDLIQALSQLVAGERRVRRMIIKIDRAVIEARSLEDLLKKCLQGGTHASAA